MLLLPWAGLEGGHVTPTQTHLGKATGWGTGQVDGSRCLRGAGKVDEWTQKRPHQESPRGNTGPRPFLLPWAALVPTRASLSVQPGSSPATRSRGRRNGLCYPPLGSKSSLVPTVEQKAAHPWTGSPHPRYPMSPPLSIFTSAWPAGLHPPPQYLAQGACPQGLQGKLHPSSSQELLQADPSTERVSLPSQATSPPLTWK